MTSVRFGQLVLVPRPQKDEPGSAESNLRQAQVLSQVLGDGVIVPLESELVSYGVGDKIHGLALTQLTDVKKNLAELFKQAALKNQNNAGQLFPDSFQILKDLSRSTLENLLNYSQDPIELGKKYAALRRQTPPPVETLVPKLANADLQEPLNKTGSALNALFQTLAVITNPFAKATEIETLSRDASAQSKELIADLARRIDTP